MANIELSSKDTVTALTDGSVDTLVTIIAGTPKLVRQIARDDLLECGHAFIYAKGVSVNHTLPTATAEKLLAFGNNGPAHIAVADQANNKITLTDAGVYRVAFELTGVMDVAGPTLVTATAYVGAAATDLEDQWEAGTGRFRLAFSGYVDVASSSQDLDVRVLGDIANQLTTKQIRLHAQRVVKE